jgi:uncharacterized protein YjbJ (UPF0337 family)
MNKDRDVLNKIYEEVYQESVPQRERFLHKFDRSDDRLIEKNYSEEDIDTIKEQYEDELSKASDDDIQKIEAMFNLFDGDPKDKEQLTLFLSTLVAASTLVGTPVSKKQVHDLLILACAHFDCWEYLVGEENLQEGFFKGEWKEEFGRYADNAANRKAGRAGQKYSKGKFYIPSTLEKAKSAVGEILLHPAVWGVVAAGVIAAAGIGFTVMQNVRSGVADVANCSHVICQTIERESADPGRARAYTDSNGNTRYRPGCPTRSRNWNDQQQRKIDFCEGGHEDAELEQAIIDNSGSYFWNRRAGSSSARFGRDKDGNVVRADTLYDKIDNFGDSLGAGWGGRRK